MSGTPRGASSIGAGNSRRSNSTSDSFGTMDVSGASLVTDAFCETVLEGKNSAVHYSTTVWPIGGVEPELSLIHI